MGFDKEHFESQLKYMKRREFQHERLVDEIKDTTCTLEHRAAACVADDPDDDAPWVQEAYEEYDQQWFVNTSLKVLENRIVDKTYIKEYRIAAANELHRRVVESGKGLPDVVDVKYVTGGENVDCSGYLDFEIKDTNRYKAFKAFKEADKPIPAEMINTEDDGDEVDIEYVTGDIADMPGLTAEYITIPEYVGGRGYGKTGMIMQEVAEMIDNDGYEFVKLINQCIPDTKIDWDEIDKPIPYVPTYDPEFTKDIQKPLIEIAEGIPNNGVFFYGEKITQEQARNMLIEHNKRPKPPKPKHPDVQRAIDNYPSCNIYAPNWD